MKHKILWMVVLLAVEMSEMNTVNAGYNCSCDSNMGIYLTLSSCQHPR